MIDTTPDHPDHPLAYGGYVVFPSQLGTATGRLVAMNPALITSLAEVHGPPENCTTPGVVVHTMHGGLEKAACSLGDMIELITEARGQRRKERLDDLRQQYEEAIAEGLKAINQTPPPDKIPL